MDSVHEGPHAGWTRPPQSQLTHQHVRLQEADVGQDIPGTGTVRTGELAPRQQTLTGNDETWILDLDRTSRVLGRGQDQQNPGTLTEPTESWDLDGTDRTLDLDGTKRILGLGRNQQSPGTWTEPTESWTWTEPTESWTWTGPAERCVPSHPPDGSRLWDSFSTAEDHFAARNKSGVSASPWTALHGLLGVLGFFFTGL